MAHLLELNLNGRKRLDAVPDHRLLLDYLRETVGLTNDGTGANPNGHIEVKGHLFNDSSLLSILLAKIRYIRSHDVKQF